MEPAILDSAPTPGISPVLASLRHVERTTGKSRVRQLREMANLFHGPGRVSPREYFYFGLYDDRLFAADRKRAFVGLELQREILYACTDKRWWALAHDKITYYALMQSYGFPIPQVSATLHPFRGLAGAQALRSREDVQAYLRDPGHYPRFCKPFDGMRSVGSARIDAYDAATDEITVYPQRRVPTSLFIDAIWKYADDGYLFQQLQHPSPAVEAMCGDRLASVRLVVLMRKSGPEVFRGVWKIPTGIHVADNYWRDGNLLCGIDVATGRVTSAMTGAGPQRVRVERHPDSGMPLVGMAIPDWTALQDACLSAAATMPGVTMQGWDAAPCRQGPVLVEVNVGGDFTLPQLGNDRGLLDDQFKAYLAEHDFSATLSFDRYLHHVKANVRAPIASALERVRRRPASAGQEGMH